MRKINLKTISRLPFAKKEIHNDSSEITEYIGICDPADNQKRGMVILKVTTPLGKNPIIERIAEDTKDDGTLFIHEWEKRLQYMYVPISHET